MKKNISEQLDDLKHIVDKAQTIVGKPEDTTNSHAMDFRLKWLLDRDFRQSTFEQHPTCFMSIRTADRNIPLLPICNRSAASDPKLLATGLGIAKSLVGVGGVDQEHLEKVIRVLTHNQRP